MAPSKWSPADDVFDEEGAQAIVSIKPWQHSNLTIGSLRVKSRSEWGANEPVWQNEVTYYNTEAYPLEKLLNRIVIHHTDNNQSIKVNEAREMGKKKFAAIGYHFFIEKDGTILEGRPLEVMGSHVGEGVKKGVLNDPDFGAIGIVVRGNYSDNLIMGSKPPEEQLQAFDDLVLALRARFPGIRRVLKHNEVVRGGDPTECPGAHMTGHVEELRGRLGL